MNKSQGYYFGSYNILMDEYLGVDFSRRCFVFPGQGAAFPGMFKNEYFNFETIREKFEKADLMALKFGLQKISDYILNPEDLKKETLPIVRNLALFTLEVALHEFFVSKKIVPKIVTGHSFGEYAALVASGIASFEEMLDIFYHRDFFCPPANSLGFMVAVSAGEKEIKNLLGETEYYVSNLNSPRQTVISVSKNAAGEISRLLEEKKIRHKILSDVPQPYHSPYLNGVKDKMEKYLANKKISFKKPKIPLFSSVTKKLIDANNFSEEDVKYILINQIITPVDFMSQVLSIYDLRCFNFIELGLKRTFSGFIEDILFGRELKTDFALNFLKTREKDSSKILNHKNSGLFSLISKIIGKITGYEIEKISFEDRYQEDLGIDSIKKADILLTVLNESKIAPGENFNTSDFKSIKDTVAYLENAGKEGVLKSGAPPRRETCFGRYVFSWKEKLLNDYFLAPERKSKYILLNIEKIYRARKAVLNELTRFLEEERGRHPNIIIRADYQEFNYDKIILFFKFWTFLLKTAKIGDFNLILASSGEPCPCVNGYASFFKSMKKELPDMFFKHIHFSQKSDEKNMLDIVLKELREPLEIDVLYRGGKRFISVRKPAAKIKNKPRINEKFVILAIGGAKGITFSLIKNISKKYKPIIYLAGKSSKENEMVQTNIKELKKNNPRIYYKSLDARDMNSLDKLFSKIKKKHDKIDLVINGAGAMEISFLKDKTNEEMERELSNKVLPAFNVLNLSLKYGPKKIINFSSIISKYGSAGQSVYTSANEIINGLAAGYNSARVIHWPPWEGVGMTERWGILKNLSDHGVSLLKPEKADELFSFDLASSGPKAVYYMDKYDDLFYGFSLSNLKEYKSLIGEISNPYNISASSLAFEKFFDLSKDVYLKDHRIKDEAYAPAAVGMGMFLCLANAYLKTFPVFQNIAINNPIVLKENEPLRCVMGAERKNGGWALSIKSNVSHFSCLARNGGGKKKARRDLVKAEKEIPRSSIYSDYYSKNSLYYGPAFQCIDRAFLDKDGNPFFAIDNSKLLPTLGLGFYDKLIQWVDVSFQALGAAGLRHNRKIIPVKVSKFCFFPETQITNYLYAIPEASKLNLKGLEGNAVVVNENGEIVLELEGVLFKTISERND